MSKIKKWDMETDVLIVGSGGAALTAALTAQDRGARTVVLERTDKVGGTTAVSGGAAWVPANHCMREVGITDTRDEALVYCKSITTGRTEDELLETFVDRGPEMLQYIEKTTSAKWVPMSMPDYHPEHEGGKRGGRAVELGEFKKEVLGEWANKLRESPYLFFPLTNEEIFRTYDAGLKPQNLPIELIEERMDRGLLYQGNALIGYLLKGCLDRNVTIFLETRAYELIRENGRVIGLRAEREGKDFLVKASGGVVLACGGFEWNERLKANFISGSLTHPHTPPFNEGDGLIMAAEVGAELANTSEAWWFPASVVPGEEYEGKRLTHLVFAERLCPHTILVNRYGQRFVNEAANYNDLGKAFSYFDPNAYGYRNLPCWAVFDSQYREKYVVVTVLPNDPDPEWLVSDETLEGLAQKVGIDPAGLKETVGRFNGFVKEGTDRDFGRGDSYYDRYIGDQESLHPNLGTIEKSPFYALPIYSGALGTKGGPRTNKEGRVLNVRGEVIPGLYAAGNAMAQISGPGCHGPGGTIGIGMTWGYMCGINAAEEARSKKS